MKQAILSTVLITLFLTCVEAQRPGDFRVIGPGGGGAMFNPTISPHDSNTVLISCDMTGSYITHDGGQNWRMFNLRGVVNFLPSIPSMPRPCMRMPRVYGAARMVENIGIWCIPTLTRSKV